MTNATLWGKAATGNPYVRLDGGKVASAKPRFGFSRDENGVTLRTVRRTKTFAAHAFGVLALAFAGALVLPGTARGDTTITPMSDSTWGYTITGLSDGTTVAVFTNTTETMTWPVPSGDVEYLVVGGGGSGGSPSAGGGGAGAYWAGTQSGFAGGSVTVRVGEGGASVMTGGSVSVNGNCGKASTLSGLLTSDITANGGAGGGGWQKRGESAGSYASTGGVGGAYDRSDYATGVAVDGDEEHGHRGGGLSAQKQYGSGGGGGAGDVGKNGNGVIGGAGGEGVANDITGVEVYYAAGGGGGSNRSDTTGAGGSGVGGRGGGSSNTVLPTAGTTPGSGGGGGGYNGTWTAEQSRGAAGANGVVILRYAATTPVPPTPTPSGVTTNAIPEHPEWGYEIHGVANNTDVVVVYTNQENSAMTWTVPAGVTSFRALVVAGGGAGGGTIPSGHIYPVNYGGGGGGGGVVDAFVGKAIVPDMEFEITVGKGGRTAEENGNGKPSSILYGGTEVVKSLGGGAGKETQGSTAEAGAVGGCGGGGGGVAKANATADGGASQSGTVSDTYVSSHWEYGRGGGSSSACQRDGSTSYNCGAGGGGGANGVGGTATTTGSRGTGGTGGDGISCDITGEIRYYAGGGGGSGRSAVAAGGRGGGGASGDREVGTLPKAGADGLGGGGGGSCYNCKAEGANGGSGVVIIRYAAPTAGAIAKTPFKDKMGYGDNGWGYVLSGGSLGEEIAVVYTNQNATMMWTVPAGVSTIQYLLVGGGGAGGWNETEEERATGGGGGGGFVTQDAFSVSGIASFNVTVGKGGVPKSSSTSTDTGIGGNSTISGGGTTITANGGGYGAGSPNAAKTGGSGGGGSPNADTVVGASGMTNQGHAGGSADTRNNTNPGGGGGGACARGSDGVNNGAAGAGGMGLTSGITGVSVTYAGGGGGGKNGLGGAGGGGNGGTNAANKTAGAGARGADGVDGLGGGGGGSGRCVSAYLATSGGSGVVIIRYAAAPTTDVPVTPGSTVKVKVSSSWIAESGKTTEQMSQPNGHGVTPAEAYVLGFPAEEVDDAAIGIAATQTATGVNLSASGLPDERPTDSGAKVQWELWCWTERTGQYMQEGNVQDTDVFQNIVLPLSGVKYFKIRSVYTNQ